MKKELNYTNLVVGKVAPNLGFGQILIHMAGHDAMITSFHIHQFAQMGSIVHLLRIDEDIEWIVNYILRITWLVDVPDIFHGHDV